MSALQHDIAIVGGGLVGLSLAAALARSRLSVVVIDAAPRQVASAAPAPVLEGASLASGVDARVSAINPTSRDFLSRIGGWPEGASRPYMQMYVADSRGTGAIEFDADSIDEPALGFIVENKRIISALTDTLEQSGVELLDNSRISNIETVEGAGYRLTLESGKEIECQLLIGADGGNSIVRKSRGMRSLSWRYPHEAVVSTIRTEAPHGAVARQWFTAEGPLAFLPLIDEHLCSIVWSSTNAPALLALDDEAMCERLTGASEFALGKVVGIDRRFSFPLQQSQVFQYVQPHLALVGDAAHTIHPLAGQGANLGLADASCLAQVILDAAFEGQPIYSTEVLREYQVKRQPLNVATAGVMEAFARIYQTDNPAIGWLRSAAFRWADSQEFAKSMLMRAASGR